MLAAIAPAKLRQLEKPWATWQWLGIVPAKAAARLQHFKDAIGKHGDMLLALKSSEAQNIRHALDTALSGLAAKLPRKEEAFSSIKGNLPRPVPPPTLATWRHPAGAEDETLLKNWKLEEGRRSLTIHYPDEIELATQQVDHCLCLVPACDGGWSLRPAKNFKQGKSSCQSMGTGSSSSPRRCPTLLVSCGSKNSHVGH